MGVGAAPQPWLNTLAADLISLTLFSGIGTALAISAPLLGVKAVVGPAAAGIGLWGAGVERGRVRPPRLGVSALLSGWAAAVHLGVEVLAGGSAALDLALAARVALIAVLGAAVPALASRFDRGESAWREAVRQGPPSGYAPLAGAVAAWRLPAPLGWLALTLVPLDWALRAGSAGAILAYQLTASRLMPSACRYEPTCSRYGFLAYARHSFLKASFLTGFRVLRCSPLGSGGYDPVPAPSPLLPSTPTCEDHAA